MIIFMLDNTRRKSFENIGALFAMLGAFANFLDRRSDELEAAV